jgi:hypothetical protein
MKMYRGAEVELHAFLTSVPDGGESSFNILSNNLKGRDYFDVVKSIWEDNIKMDLGERRYEVTDCIIGLAQQRVQ